MVRLRACGLQHETHCCCVENLLDLLLGLRDSALELQCMNCGEILHLVDTRLLQRPQLERRLRDGGWKIGGRIEGENMTKLKRTVYSVCSV